MRFNFGQFRPKYNVPKFGRHAESKLLSAKMVLIVVLLKSMEIWPLWFGSVDVMKQIMRDVVHEVSNHESEIECEINMGIGEINHLIDSEISQCESNDSQCRWEDQPIPK